jgi:hypothetical protein
VTTISLDRTSVVQPTTQPGDAHLAACSLHLLLAQHPELVDMPFEWRITADGTVRPMVEVDHPQGRIATELLAAALELDITVGPFRSRDGQACEALYVTGRWGGALWRATVFVPAEGGDRDE